MSDRDQAALGFLNAAPLTADMPSLIDRFETVIRLFGFSTYACMHVADPGHPTRPTPLFANLTADWAAHYVDAGYARIDAALRRVFITRTPYTWGEVAERIATPEQLRIHDAAADHGYREGLIVPVHGARGEVSAMVLLSDEREPAIDAQSRAVLAAISGLAATHARTLLEIGADADDGGVLARRETECLIWTARGKGVWEIGVILGISARTVETHLTNARSKLDAPTKSQAVLEAWRRGLLVE